MTPDPPEDDGRTDHARLARQNANVAIDALRDGQATGAQVAADIAGVHAHLELAHQVARVAAALERTARG